MYVLDSGSKNFLATYKRLYINFSRIFIESIPLRAKHTQICSMLCPGSNDYFPPQCFEYR